MDHLHNLAHLANHHPDPGIRYDLQRLQKAVEAAPVLARIPDGVNRISRILTLAANPTEMTSWGNTNRHHMGGEISRYEETAENHA